MSRSARPAGSAIPNGNFEKQLATTLRFGYGLQLVAPPLRLPGPPDVDRYACVTNAGPFVLRAFQPIHSTEAMQRSIDIAEALVNSGFPTAAPLHTHDERSLVAVGPRYAALFYPIEGKTVGRSAREIRAIGHTIGRLHLLCSYEDSSTLMELPLRSALEARLARISSGILSSAAAEVASSIQERLTYLELAENLPQGILHGSLTAEQLVAGFDGTVYIHDSDVFARGPLLLDLAMIAADCCVQPPTGPGLSISLLSELIEGYSLGARRKIWMEEWHALPMMIYYGTLLLSASQLAAQAESLADANDLPAWSTAWAIEEGWEQFSSTLVEMGLDQIAPFREL